MASDRLQGPSQAPASAPDPGGRWELRWHPLLEQWVVVAAHRDRRPWNGLQLGSEREVAARHEPACHLCPGNVRVSGRQNPHYRGLYVFDNDHPGLALHAPTDLPKPPGIYRNAPARGAARVVCYSERHDVSLAMLTPGEVEQVFAGFAREVAALQATPGIRSVVPFENRGAVCGVSSPHPHGQIIATSFCYANIERHLRAAAAHRADTGRGLFDDIIASEELDGRRMLVSHGSALAFVPYFARYPYEVFVAPRRQHATLMTMSDAEMADLAAALREVLVMYDNLWRGPFPYIMMLHQAPVDGGSYDDFHLHVQLYPPLRRPGLVKVQGGPELGGGNFHADTLPEEKAEDLRAMRGTHWQHRSTTPTLGLSDGAP